MNTIKIMWLFGLVGILNINIISAQDVNSEEVMSVFSLEEAVEYALTNNYSAKNADLDIIAANKEVWKTIATGLPQANGKFDFQYIPGTIPTFSIPGSTDEIPLQVKNSGTYSLTVSQLIFSGEYIVGLQATKTYLQISKDAKEKTDLDIKESVMNGYYTVLILKNNLEILDSSIASFKKTLSDTKAMYENGFIEETDLEQLEVSLNELLNSRKAIFRQIDISYLILKMAMGIPADQSISLSENLDGFLSRIDNELLMNAEFITEENIEYKILENQERISALNLRREKAKFLPTLSGFYQYSDRTNKPVFDFTINHIVGLNLSVPVFSSGQRIASVQQARVELEKSKNNKETLDESLNMVFEQLKKDFISAYETYTTQKRNIELTKKIYNKTLIKFNEGVASSKDVADANKQYLDANSTYNKSISDFLSAKLALEKSINEL
jgi:outer membrane protein